MPEGVEYLDLEDVLALIRALAVGPVRDLGLLDSAVARARSSAYGDDAYATLPLKAAALLESLARNHALIDGNKRLAWLAAVVFVDLNGHEIALSADEAFDLVIDVATGRTDVASSSDRLRIAPRIGL